MLNKPRRFTGWIVSGLVFGSIALTGVGCGPTPESPEVAVQPEPTESQTPPRPAPQAEVAPPSPGPVLPTVPPECPSPEGFEDLRTTARGVRFDLRYATDDNFTGAPLPGYVGGVVWGVEGLGEALSTAAASVGEAGYDLVVYDAYRPPRASRAMVAFARESGREDWLRDGYIASKSNHARGTTVDLGLRGKGELEDADMGTPFDTFSPASHYRGVNGEAFGRRELLRKAMAAAGFVAYEAEWWHFELARDPKPPRRPEDYCGVPEPRP